MHPQRKPRVRAIIATRKPHESERRSGRIVENAIVREGAA